MSNTDTSTPTEAAVSPTRPEPVPYGAIAKRAGVALGAILAVLGTLGLIGRLFVFDRSIGDAEADLVASVAERRTDVLDTFFSNASAVSDTFTVLGVLVGGCTMLWATGWRRHATMLALSVVLEFLGFIIVGTLVDRSRPAVEALHSEPSTASFPSGHTAAAFVVYAALIYIARSLAPRSTSRWLWAFPIVFTVAVAAARVYEGVHYPLDVAAGLLLGVGALVGAAWAVDIRIKPSHPVTSDDGDTDHDTPTGEPMASGLR